MVVVVVVVVAAAAAAKDGRDIIECAAFCLYVHLSESSLADSKCLKFS